MVDKTYQYWIYFIKEKFVDDIPLVLNDNFLYAYTDNKDLAHEFELYRDMSKFVKKKCELTRKDVNMLAKDERNQILKFRECVTKSSNGEAKYTLLVMTIQEEKYLDMHVMTYLHNFVYKELSPFPVNIIDDELINDLEALKFFTLSNYSIVCDDLYMRPNFVEIRQNKNTYKVFADEVSVFVNTFKHVLREV